VKLFFSEVDTAAQAKKAGNEKSSAPANKWTTLPVDEIPYRSARGA
jgi:hypothetical protein